VIYYSEKDNVCAYTQQDDDIEITLNLEGYPLLKFHQWGFTFCKDTPYYDRDRIIADGGFYYTNFELGDEVLFFNKLTKNHIRGVLINMVVNTTLIDDECRLRGRKCSCKILGDGKQQHFGTIFPNHPPASIYLQCKFTDQEIQ
jgi:hypothetical protein